MGLIGLLMVFAGCKKYEHGPAISFKSIEKRITGVWEVEEWVKPNGFAYDPTTEEIKLRLTLDEGGAGSMNYDYTQKVADVDWELYGDNEFVKIRYTWMEDSTTTDWYQATILKLTSKKFWVLNENLTETHFEKVK